MAGASNERKTASRGARGWARFVLVSILTGLALLLAAGLVYQALAVAADERRYPPPGEMVDVGGYRMHLDISGGEEGHEDAPTVLLDAGSQSASFQWGWMNGRSLGQPGWWRTTVRAPAGARPRPGPSTMGSSPKTFTRR